MRALCAKELENILENIVIILEYICINVFIELPMALLYLSKINTTLCLLL